MIITIVISLDVELKYPHGDYENWVICYDLKYLTCKKFPKSLINDITQTFVWGQKVYTLSWSGDVIVVGKFKIFLHTQL